MPKLVIIKICIHVMCYIYIYIGYPVGTCRCNVYFTRRYIRETFQDRLFLQLGDSGQLGDIAVSGP